MIAAVRGLRLRNKTAESLKLLGQVKVDRRTALWALSALERALLVRDRDHRALQSIEPAYFEVAVRARALGWRALESRALAPLAHHCLDGEAYGTDASLTGMSQTVAAGELMVLYGRHRDQIVVAAIGNDNVRQFSICCPHEEVAAVVGEKRAALARSLVPLRIIREAKQIQVFAVDSIPPIPFAAYVPDAVVTFRRWSSTLGSRPPARGSGKGVLSVSDGDEGSERRAEATLLADVALVADRATKQDLERQLSARRWRALHLSCALRPGTLLGFGMDRLAVALRRGDELNLLDLGPPSAPSFRLNADVTVLSGAFAGRLDDGTVRDWIRACTGAGTNYVLTCLWPVDRNARSRSCGTSTATWPPGPAPRKPSNDRRPNFARPRT